MSPSWLEESDFRQDSFVCLDTGRRVLSFLAVIHYVPSQGLLEQLFVRVGRLLREPLRRLPLLRRLRRHVSFKVITIDELKC